MQKPNTADLLAKLVAFDTTSHCSNLPLIEFIADYLEKYGVASHRVMDASSEKANLYATIGPRERSGLMLSGHTDTVPTTGQHWSVATHELTARENRLYGRGTADMKGFLAAVLAAIPVMVRADLQIPLHLAFSHDEEVGCIGVRTLIADLATQPRPPIACLVGEPTSMRLSPAHKGKLAMRVEITGRACHSGMAPEGVNAIQMAARLVGWIEKKADEKSVNGPFDKRFAMPYTTLQVGTIRGGGALNIVPEACCFDFEIRNVPGDDPEALVAQLQARADDITAEMRQTHPGAGIHMERLTDYPGLSMDEDTSLIRFIRSLLADKKAERIGFGTEGGLFQQRLGIPVVVCGPGSMDQGHQPDEFITLEQLECCDSFLSDLIVALEQPDIAQILAVDGVSAE
jgi:acetylornithine deacetylase